ncbi:MAG: hypothetical protein V1742_05025 [Pseudomonadota bacterium]
MGDKIFTEAELEALGRRTLDVLQETLDRGDLEQAKKLGKRMYIEFSAMHDLYMNWITDLLTFIGERYGDEDLSAALEKAVGTFTRALGPIYAGKDLRRQVEILMTGLRGHLAPVQLEEDEEKITLRNMCGSGGRLVQQKAYDPPRNCLKIKTPQPMTFGRPDFPVYCAHCHFQNIIPMSPGQAQPYLIVPAEKIGQGPCTAYFFKKEAAALGRGKSG